VLGALTLVSWHRDFDVADLEFAGEFARRAALALDNARLYTEAQVARRDAEQASRTKDEFLAMLGHELRNPLAPIVTALHIMSMRGDDTSTAERRIIERQVAHLSRLVDDLLDVSRITRGKIELRREVCDVAAIFDKAIELAQPLLDRRRRAIDVELPAEALRIVADPVRMAQVLSNLLTNAAKFTPDEGRITVSVRGDDDWIDIAVEDTGVGIGPELLPQEFDLFVQGAQPVDRRVGGIGLGLTIVKGLVEAHGGHAAVQSEMGVGTSLFFTLPATEAASVDRGV
jgi:signal transduction histidine kinase